MGTSIQRAAGARIGGAADRRCGETAGASPSTALLLASVEEGELLEIDGLSAASAAAGPAAQDGL
jgi:hypothetical protein